MTNNKGSLDSRNSLILKIAVFLNFISKENHSKLLKDIKNHPDKNKIDVLKIMLAKKYISPSDLTPLKQTVLKFARNQEDTRFGSLAIEFKFITQSNLNLALEEQNRLAESGITFRIGDLLVDAGMLSERQRNLILQKQKIEGMGKTDAGREDTNNGTEKQTEIPAEEKTKKDVDEFILLRMREINEPEVTIYIRDDGLKAYLKKNKDFDPGILVADLKLLLEKNGIIYGVVDDADLTNFINLPKYRDAEFVVAAGLAPVDGKDAQVIYMFERDYLKAGSLSEDGTMDFKDRGDIPFVSQGDVLAEKIPARDGKDGVSVYGDTIPKKEPEDFVFNIGKGVHLSRDELKVIAASEGNPKVDKNGEISVNSAYLIEGDVDYTTGHVKFDKNVFIAGSIKNGFRVEAIDVVAKTIDGGIVKAKGDIFVQSGITESTIEAKGNIKAAYLHSSNAKCMGDLNIYKEVVDTQILTEGAFNMGKGKVIASSICAKGGAKVFSVGSEKAKASSITVGTSQYYENELTAIDADIDRRQIILEEATLRKNNLTAEIAAIDDKLQNFDKSRQRTLSMLESLNSQNGEDNGKIFRQSLLETEEKIKDLSDRKQLLEANLNKISADIVSHADAVKVAVKQKFSLKRLNQANPPKPVVEVYGKAYAGTKFSGKHSHLYLSRDISRSRIMEMDNSSKDTMRSNWNMVITNL